MPGKKFVQPLRQRKKFVQANNKVQIVLKKIRAEVKCIKKKSCRYMSQWKKNSCRKNFIPPLPGFLMVRPLYSLDSFRSQFKISQRFTVSIYLYLQSLFRPPTRPIDTFLEREVKPFYQFNQFHGNEVKLIYIIQSYILVHIYTYGGAKTISPVWFTIT
jgi:hypothetical protein